MKNSKTFHKGQAVPLNRDNIDTDQIIPKQFLKSIKKSGFGPNLFDAWRYEDEGYPGQEVQERKINKEFILNQEKYKHSDILVSKKNFGCGSSREHAVWSLMDYGFKVVIAESFADIFYNNCFQNGILPIVVSPDQLDKLMTAAKNQTEFTIDLPEQTIKAGNHSINFEIEDFRKDRLLQGLDDIGITLGYQDKINAYEEDKKNKKPWLFKEN